jgi:hypothetical protein
MQPSRVERAPRIPIVLCIDVEPDPRVLPQTDAPPWVGFEETDLYFGAVRLRWLALTGAPPHLCWFLRMDPQIAACYEASDFAVRCYPVNLSELTRHGDELGLHVHGSRFDAGRAAFVVDNGNAAWMEHCVRSSLEAYREAFDSPCRSFRFGDGWTSQAAFDLLEELGVLYELTAEPGAPARPCLVPGEALFTGALPGWAGIPTRPYRPARGDYRTPDPARRDGLWIIPMSSGNGVNASQETTPDRPVRTLNLTLEPDIFRAIAERILTTEQRPYLGLMVRSEAILDAMHRRRIDENLEMLATHRLANRFRLSRPDEALALLGLNEASPGR